MAGRTWRQGVLAIPGIGVALLPKLACPLCDAALFCEFGGGDPFHDPIVSLY